MCGGVRGGGGRSLLEIRFSFLLARSRTDSSLRLSAAATGGRQKETIRFLLRNDIFIADCTKGSDKWKMYRKRERAEEGERDREREVGSKGM